MKYITFSSLGKPKRDAKIGSVFKREAIYGHETALLKEFNEPDTEIALSELYCAPECWTVHEKLDSQIGEILWTYQTSPIRERQVKYLLPATNYYNFLDVAGKISEDSSHTGVDVVVYGEGDDAEVHFFSHPKESLGKIEFSSLFKKIFEITSDKYENGVRHIIAREGQWVYREKVNRLMFVYCDVIEPRLVGDSESRLLRVIPMCGRDEWVAKIFKKRFYFKLQNSRLTKVAFSFLNEFGRRIYLKDFQLTLHIRHHG